MAREGGREDECPTCGGSCMMEMPKMTEIPSNRWLRAEGGQGATACEVDGEYVAKFRWVPKMDVVFFTNSLATNWAISR